MKKLLFLCLVFLFLAVDYLRAISVQNSYSDPCNLIHIGMTIKEVKNAATLFENDGQYIIKSPCNKGMRYTITFRGHFFWKRLAEIQLYSNPIDSINRVNAYVNRYAPNFKIKKEDVVSVYLNSKTVYVFFKYPELLINLQN